MNFGLTGKNSDGMKDPLVPSQGEKMTGDELLSGEKKGIGGVIFPADDAKVPVSAFVNPKNPDKVDTEALNRDTASACIITVTDGTGRGDPQQRALKEMIAGSVCLGLVVTVALVLLGGSYSLGYVLDFASGGNMNARHYRGWCAVPYNYWKQAEASGDLLLADDIPLFFHERFVLNVESRGENEIMRAEVEVPDFKGGRHGKFLHDFRKNLTAIVDMTGGRCFVLPLDTEHVLPPQSLANVFQDMKNGRFQVDTAVIRETMRVIWPPIEDVASLGVYIGWACQHRQTFRLEKIDPETYCESPPCGNLEEIQKEIFEKVHDMVESEGDIVRYKRDVSPKGIEDEKNSNQIVKKRGLVFAEFAGKNVVEFDIVGLAA
ncbi:unnamed protein product [Notodromas monacha]|uniref:BRICHOS domain-containing protein n=1 Tax=Notodromas monacha TaxID=399045 RepID=A0A7R9BKZ1_9CRUS|nr:unnamed protein product [Notodromas monacha]CAG0916625.1 unnamed protein product [Notodromas monacha]